MEEGTQTWYVSSLNATVAAGAAILTPIISSVTDGVILTINRAVISADRKYVTLDMQPTLDQVISFQSFSYETGVSTTTGTSTGGTTVIGGGFTAPTATIQEPVEVITAVRTRVTVPDGGTVLLGGLSINGEAHVEQGVPVLSKVPFLQRLTTSTGQAKGEQIMLILVKPSIVIDKEYEARSFPTLSTGKTP
jgi:general secretion pathway protein D